MRSPTALLQRYGRQLLVEGIGLRDQLRLGGHAAVLRGDDSAFALAALEATARYLVGAGVGRLSCPDGAGWALGELDAGIELVPARGAGAPATHVYLARRPYGASADLLRVPEATEEGADTAVCTMAVTLGEPARAVDAVFVGAMAADLVLCDLLGLEPLPSSVRLSWPAAGDPELIRRPAPAGRASHPGSVSPALPGILAEIKADAAVWGAVAADARVRYPNEACGLVLRGGDGALRALPCDNLQDRYHGVDPVAFPRTARTAFRLNELAIARAAEGGETLVCIYHSHCDAGPYFSAEDIRCASPGGEPSYPGVAWMVLSVSGGEVVGAQAYHFDAADGRWHPEAGSAA